MAEVHFEDFSFQCRNAISEAANQFLEEAASELESQAQRNTAVVTGQLKGSWDHVVDEGKHEATIGSPLEYAIWQEFGTGEYALEGNGRKTPWFYEDAQGEGHYTSGNKPKRMLWNAFNSSKSKIIARAEEVLKGLN